MKVLTSILLTLCLATSAFGAGIYNFTDTWDDGGDNTTISCDTLDTSSNASSDVIRMLVDSANVFTVSKTGAGYFADATGIGTSTLDGISSGAKLEVATSDDFGGIVMSTWSTVDADAGVLTFLKSAHATIGTHAIVAQNETIGYLSFKGSDGTTFDSAATILAAVDGSPSGSTDMPGRLVFKTAPDGSATPTEAMRITSEQRMGIGTTTPGGLLHVSGGTTGATADAGADEVIVEENGAGGISVLTTDAASGTIALGSASDAVGSSIVWNHDGDLLQVQTNNAGAELALETADGVEAVRIDASQDVTLNAGKMITGNGGAVTQITSITTGVTLNTDAGEITTVSAALGAGVDATFTVTNSAVEAADCIIVNTKTYGGTADGIPICTCQSVAAGSFEINIRNTGAVALDAVVVISFVVIGGSAS